ncbi:kinase-like domain-containing protein [Baffinella frigidus]|nr:kinase-like domain-containing protein [Cryptophyta sp. CCMP2293]
MTIGLLGHGSHGTCVYRGTLQGRPVAIKRMLREFGVVAQAEISLLLASDAHPNVLKYYGTEEDGAFVYLAVQLCAASLHQLHMQGGEAARLDFESSCSPAFPPHGPVRAKGGIVHALPALPEPRIAFAQLLDGLDFLHSLGIVHRDLKPHNILVDATGVVKIADMGLAKRLDPEGQASGNHSFHTSAAGTLGWRAPEQVRGERCGKAVDLFSSGCIFFYLLTKGKHPFGAHAIREANVVSGTPDISAISAHPEVGDRELEP